MPPIIEKQISTVQVREISPLEKEYWDKEMQRFEFAHPLNAFAWGEVRSVDGWIPRYLVAEREDRCCGGMMILVKKIPFTPFAFLYGQKGPIWDYADEEAVCELLKKVKEIARETRAIFLRIDPNIPESVIEARGDLLTKLGFVHLEPRWNFWNSPRDVYRIDLTKANNADELFNMLDRDTRRCIRKAAKEGVVIEPTESEEEFKEFYNIFKEFSVNRGFMSRGYEYQKALWDTYIANDMGRLFLAKYKERIIGGLICIMYSRKCLAMHMGTPYEFHKLQTNYAYVWESIRWAKEKGCTWYSFRGSGSTPSQEYFKLKFVPTVVSLIGYYDFPFHPFLHKLFTFTEFSVIPKTWPFLYYFRKKYHNVKTVLKER